MSLESQASNAEGGDRGAEDPVRRRGGGAALDGVGGVEPTEVLAANRAALAGGLTVDSLLGDDRAKNMLVDAWMSMHQGTKELFRIVENVAQGMNGGPGLDRDFNHSDWKRVYRLLKDRFPDSQPLAKVKSRFSNEYSKPSHKYFRLVHLALMGSLNEVHGGAIRNQAFVRVPGFNEEHQKLAEDTRIVELEMRQQTAKIDAAMKLWNLSKALQIGHRNGLMVPQMAVDILRNMGNLVVLPPDCRGGEVRNPNRTNRPNRLQQSDQGSDIHSVQDDDDFYMNDQYFEHGGGPGRDALAMDPEVEEVPPAVAIPHGVVVVEPAAVEVHEPGEQEVQQEEPVITSLEAAKAMDIERRFTKKNTADANILKLSDGLEEFIYNFRAKNRRQKKLTDFFQ